MNERADKVWLREQQANDMHEDWRQRGGDQHKAELERIRQRTEVALASEAYDIASRNRYTAEIAKVGMDGLAEVSDKADRITRLRPHLARKLEAVEDEVVNVIRYNVRRYGTGDR